MRFYNGLKDILRPNNLTLQAIAKVELSGFHVFGSTIWKPLQSDARFFTILFTFLFLH